MGNLPLCLIDGLGNSGGGGRLKEGRRCPIKRRRGSSAIHVAWQVFWPRVAEAWPVLADAWENRCRNVREPRKSRPRRGRRGGLGLLALVLFNLSGSLLRLSLHACLPALAHYTGVAIPSVPATAGDGTQVVAVKTGERDTTVLGATLEDAVAWFAD